MTEPPRVFYVCRSCNTIFFSPDAVIEHKAMTDHGEFVERER